MFGYVRPHKGELLVKEYEAYKAVYCTLCRELGKHYGALSRMALSYDLTYYAMLALDLEGAKPQLRKGRCVVNPAKKCNYICEGQTAYHKAAALTVMMTYQKLRDNLDDEGFFGQFAAAILMPFVKGPYKKAAKDFPFMAEAIEEMMKAQRQAELDSAGIDACCDPVAKALSVIFAELGDDERKKLILSQLGYFLGRWIYAIDAADDLPKDLKEGSFNPLIKKFGLENSKEIPEDRRDEIDNECNSILNNNVAMINSAVNLLELGIYKNILENVSMKGMAEVQREILFLHIHDRKKKRLGNEA